MQQTFWERLNASVRARDSLLCVGLDPHDAPLPDGHESLEGFLRAVIDATADVACVYKPNIAFYEARGEEGLRTLRRVLDYVPEDIPVILDAKRADIASTGVAYARAVFGWLGVDAVTVNPYLGEDGVAPFLAYEDRGVFILCKTSNPSAGQFQDWSQGGEPLYRHVARQALSWAKGRPVGLVIGATYPEAISDVRQNSQEAWFLIPGVGAQGGDLDAALEAGLDQDGAGVLINSSRGILYAPDPGIAARELRARINDARCRISKQRSMRYDLRIRRLARLLFEAGCVRFGDFVLHSGAHSPVYVDLRLLPSHPRILQEVAGAYARLLRQLTYQRVAAVPYAGLPLGAAVCLQTGDPMIYPRREAKGYGTRRQVEGVYHAGERVVLLDDLISSGGSKLEALALLEAEGLVCEDVVVLIDRQQGGAEELAAHGYRLHAAVTLQELVDVLEQDGAIDAADARRVRRYLSEQQA